MNHVFFRCCPVTTEPSLVLGKQEERLLFPSSGCMQTFDLKCTSLVKELHVLHGLDQADQISQKR